MTLALRFISVLVLLTSASAAVAQAPQAPSDNGVPTRYVAPLPVEVALRELHALQQHERELWEKRVEHCTGCGAAAIGVGAPFMVTFAPWGALLLASARYGDDEEDDSTFDRRLGGSLLALGIAGLAGVVWGSWKVAKGHRARNAAEFALRSSSERRTLLEQILESALIGAAPPIPPAP